MIEWINIALDVVVVALISAGLVQATRLIRHLAGLRQGRLEMERFVYEFNATVIRAEAGIKGLRQAARDSGDDLEKLVEKAVQIKDELQYIVQSADQVAERLSKAASGAVRPEAPAAKAAKPQPASKPEAATPEPAPSSHAEKELMQALKKLS